MQLNCSSTPLSQFPTLLPVLFGYNYKINTVITNTDSESTAGNGKNEDAEMKELWSAEELTENLVNKTAMRIANLKHKFDEQLKAIKILQENNEKCRERPQLIHEEKNVANSRSFHNSSLSSNGGETASVGLKKQGRSNSRIAKTNEPTSTKVGIQRRTGSQMKRRKRLRRGVPIKEFFYHPLVVDCRASIPEELTKEEFLRQLRLIPTTYSMNRETK